MTILSGDPVRLPRVMDGQAQQVIRIGMVGHDDKVADILVNVHPILDASKIASIIRAGFYRAVDVSAHLDKPVADQLSVAILSSGATMNIVDRLWSE